MGFGEVDIHERREPVVSEVVAGVVAEDAGMSIEIVAVVYVQAAAAVVVVVIVADIQIVNVAEAEVFRAAGICSGVVRNMGIARMTDFEPL